MSNSKPTVVEEDFLDVDPEIRGQSFVCISFLSPEKILEKKELFFFQRFMKFYEAKVRFDALEKFLATVVRDQNEKVEDVRGRVLGKITDGTDTSKEAQDDLRDDIDQAFTKAKLNIADVFDSFKSYLDTHRAEMTSKTNIVDAYEEFMFTKRKELEDEFHAANDFRTTVRGVKVRGSYGTQKEANARAKKLQKDDPLHNVFVGQVGYWLPWDPNPEEVSEQQYAEKELNELMHKYKEQQEVKKELFEAEKARKIEAAKADSNARSKDVDEEDTDAKPAPPSVVVAPEEQINGISEARMLMEEMDGSRIALNPSEEFRARKRLQEERDAGEKETGDDE